MKIYQLLLYEPLFFLLYLCLIGCSYCVILYWKVKLMILLRVNTYYLTKANINDSFVNSNGEKNDHHLDQDILWPLKLTAINSSTIVFHVISSAVGQLYLVRGTWHLVTQLKKKRKLCVPQVNSSKDEAYFWIFFLTSNDSEVHVYPGYIIQEDHHT